MTPRQTPLALGEPTATPSLRWLRCRFCNADVGERYSLVDRHVVGSNAFWLAVEHTALPLKHGRRWVRLASDVVNANAAADKVAVCPRCRGDGEPLPLSTPRRE